MSALLPRRGEKGRDPPDQAPLPPILEGGTRTSPGCVYPGSFQTGSGLRVKRLNTWEPKSTAEPWIAVSVQDLRIYDSSAFTGEPSVCFLTNLPKEIMTFPDHAFAPSLPSFVHHEDVLMYLQSYAERFGVLEHVKFRCLVESVRPVPSSAGQEKVAWDVTACCARNPLERVTERFHAVMVCSGHYSEPYIPPIPGMEEFEGLLLHSHSYRSPELFSGQTVVLLGAGPSGTDIALELSATAEQVILSHRKPPLDCPLPANLLQAPAVRRLSRRAVTLEDDSRHRADAFIFCTGYSYHFPFLGDEARLRVDEDFVYPLYKHLVHARLPTLFFVGLCKTLLPFPHFDCQVQFSLAVLEGSCPLPPAARMEAEVEAEYQRHLSAGGQPKYFHRLDALQWSYNRGLAAAGGFPPLPPVVQKIYEATRVARSHDLMGYKEVTVLVLGPEEYRLEKETGGSEGPRPEAS
ncbi:flavin-containing monooxygenase FMO GS-OX-like 4 isoform X2 [Rhinatrema bivittatum]|uniref:flavin-containing monooxygenase FMO GS-OX-like 4 isoform X2 n=1 Tax=Rhinatrema bivittatum TaxID=194408 RepID=UPI00112D42AF|nr:flavin-containing monooxygenase FMO GS-OX-like 4 isoform X2 [Rhinatrema bivittatum]